MINNLLKEGKKYSIKRVTAFVLIYPSFLQLTILCIVHAVAAVPNFLEVSRTLIELIIIGVGLIGASYGISQFKNYGVKKYAKDSSNIGRYN